MGVQTATVARDWRASACSSRRRVLCSCWLGCPNQACKGGEIRTPPPHNVTARGNNRLLSFARRHGCPGGRRAAPEEWLALLLLR